MLYSTVDLQEFLEFDFYLKVSCFESDVLLTFTQMINPAFIPPTLGNTKM